MKQRVMLTGATGFVGSHLADAFLNENWDLSLYVRRRTSHINTLEQRGARVVIGDNTNTAAMSTAIKDADLFVHCAAATKAFSEKDYISANVTFTETLTAILPDNINVIYISSLAAAGPGTANQPRLETDPVDPKTWYGKSKLKGEGVVFKWGQTHGERFTILRPSIVYGPRERDMFQAFKMIQTGLCIHACSPSYRCSLIHVDDLVQGVLACCRSNGCGKTYFLTNDREAPSWPEIFQQVATALDKQRLLHIRIPDFLVPAYAMFCELTGGIVGKPPLINQQKILEMRNSWVCSSQEFQKDYDWDPKLDITAGMEETAIWYRNNNWL